MKTSRTKSLVIAISVALASTSAPFVGATAVGASSVSRNVQSASKGTVAFSISTLADPGQVVEFGAVKNAVAADGYAFSWTDANNDASTQLSNITTLLAKHPSLLLVLPVQTAPLAPVLNLANEAGVPVISVDRNLPQAAGSGMYIAYVGWNWVKVGNEMAEGAVNYLKQKYGAYKGNLVHVEGIVGASPTTQVETGIQQVLKNYPNIKIVGTCDGQYIEGPGGRAWKTSCEKFGAGTIQGVISDDDASGMGALLAIQAAKRTELLGAIFSHDADIDFLQALLKGQTGFTVRRPVMPVAGITPGLGQQAMLDFLAWKEHKPFPANTYLPVIPYGLVAPGTGAGAVKAEIALLEKLHIPNN